MKTLSSKSQTATIFGRLNGILANAISELRRINDLYEDQMYSSMNVKTYRIERKTVKGYLHSLSHVLFIDNYRKAVRDKYFIECKSEAIVHRSVQKVCGMSLYESYNISEIRVFINSLSSENKEHFMMHLSGLDYHEIAARMNIPITIIKNRFSYSQEALNEILKH